MMSQDSVACNFIGPGRLAGGSWGTGWLWSGCGSVVVLLTYNLVQLMPNCPQSNIFSNDNEKKGKDKPLKHF